MSKSWKSGSPRHGSSRHGKGKPSTPLAPLSEDVVVETEGQNRNIVISAFSALTDYYVTDRNLVSRPRLQAVIIKIRELCTPPNTSQSMTTLSKELTKTIEKTNFDESWFQELVDTWLLCCLEAGGSWDHRTIPLARALEMIYELTPRQKGDLSRNAGNVYQAGAAMAVFFSKDVIEMKRFAEMSYAFEKGYLPDTRKHEPDRSREYVMACKNLAVAYASNGNLLNMLRKALAAHEQRFKQEFSLSYGSDIRYKRDEFEIRYHIYMAEGLMASLGHMKHKEAEEAYRKAEELIREPPTETKTTEGMAAESSTATEGKTTEGKTAKEKTPAWKSTGAKIVKKKTTGGSSAEGEGKVVVNKDTIHPNERLMREIQLNYARATCMLAGLDENKNAEDGTRGQTLTQCYEHYKKARHAMQDLELNDYAHRWTAMCDIQLGLLEARYPHLNSRPKHGLRKLATVTMTVHKSARPAYDRDYARAAFLYTECLESVGHKSEAQANRQASDAKENKQGSFDVAISEYNWTHADSLVEYNHLDSLDIYLKQVAGVGEEPILGKEHRQELAAQYRARSSGGKSRDDKKPSGSQR